MSRKKWLINLQQTTRSAFREFVIDVNLRRSLKNAGWLYLGTILAILFQTTEAILTARYLGASEFGQITIAIALIYTVQKIIDARLWETLTRYLHLFMSERNNLAALLIRLVVIGDCISAILSVALLLTFSHSISSLLSIEPSISILVGIYSYSILLTALNGSASAILRVCNRYRALATRTVVLSACRFSFVLVVINANGTTIDFLFAYLLADALGSMYLVASAYWEYRRLVIHTAPRAKIADLHPYAPEMRSFLIHNFLRGTLKTIFENADILLIGSLRSSNEVGSYRIARKLADTVVQLTDPLYHVLLPELSHVWARSRESFVCFARRVAILSLAIAIPLGILGVLSADIIISQALGPGFSGTAPVFSIIIAANAIGIAFFWGTPASLASGNSLLSLRAFATSALMQLVVLIALVPKLGPLGGALSILAFHSCWAVYVGSYFYPMFRRQDDVDSSR